jgi:hypothetical protein
MDEWFAAIRTWEFKPVWYARKQHGKPEVDDEVRFPAAGLELPGKK